MPPLSLAAQIALGILLGVGLGLVLVAAGRARRTRSGEPGRREGRTTLERAPGLPGASPRPRRRASAVALAALLLAGLYLAPRACGPVSPGDRIARDAPGPLRATPAPEGGPEAAPARPDLPDLPGADTADAADARAALAPPGGGDGEAGGLCERLQRCCEVAGGERVLEGLCRALPGLRTTPVAETACVQLFDSATRLLEVGGAAPPECQ